MVVVYHLHPTSNRNLKLTNREGAELYIIFILHQTATDLQLDSLTEGCISSSSYIKPQLCHIFYFFIQVVYHLHPTSNRNCRFSFFPILPLYIIFILHQTATCYGPSWLVPGCISSSSYIKPQRPACIAVAPSVVYHLHPTSNRNFLSVHFQTLLLYIIFILHQTATWVTSLIVKHRCISSSSYIKPQLNALFRFAFRCCISSSSYIKPQHGLRHGKHGGVVYHLHPTSNRNYNSEIYCCANVVYHLHPTSNRN